MTCPVERTNADKRKAVSGMLADFSDWSDSRIARHVGVSAPFVGAVRSPEVAERQQAARDASAAKKAGAKSDYAHADKRRAVLGTLELKPEWSDRAIAKHVGVNHQMVATCRPSLDDSSSEKPTERTYTTKHGTTATMKVDGQKKAGK